MLGKRLGTFIVLTLAAILISTLSLNVVRASAQSWKEYKNNRFGFSLNYPAELEASRASRTVNRHVVEGLHAHGYTGLGSTHTALLSNMPLAGGTVTETAERAGMTKQAMGRLAAELEIAGYISVTSDPGDRRAKRLELTEAGKRLMLDSLDVMAELEQRYADLIGRDRLWAVLDGLQAFNETAE